MERVQEVIRGSSRTTRWSATRASASRSSRRGAAGLALGSGGERPAPVRPQHRHRHRRAPAGAADPGPRGQVEYLTSDTVWELRELPRGWSCWAADRSVRAGAVLRALRQRGHPRRDGTALLPREDADAAAEVEARFRGGPALATAHRALRVETGRRATAAGLRARRGRGRVALRPAAGGARPQPTSRASASRSSASCSASAAPCRRRHAAHEFSQHLRLRRRRGPYQFTHVAAHQAWYAAVNGLLAPFWSFRADYRVIPWATFTEPEVARVGLSEDEARAQGIAYEVTRYGIDDLDRAIADGADHGFVKVLTKPGKDRILGATIVGAEAGNLIAEFVLAMKHKLGLNKLLGTIHIYPTMMEANKYAAGGGNRRTRRRRALRLAQRLFAWRRRLKLSVIIPVGPGEPAWPALLGDLAALATAPRSSWSRRPAKARGISAARLRLERAAAGWRRHGPGAPAECRRGRGGRHAVVPACRLACRRRAWRGARFAGRDALGYFDLRFATTARAGAAECHRRGLRSRWLGLPFGDQGLLICRAALRGARRLRRVADLRRGPRAGLGRTARRRAARAAARAGADQRAALCGAGWLRTTLRHARLTVSQARQFARGRARGADRHERRRGDLREDAGALAGQDPPGGRHRRGRSRGLVSAGRGAVAPWWPGAGPNRLLGGGRAARSARGAVAGTARCWQGEGELGARMGRVHAELLARHDFALLLGADTPQLGRACSPKRWTGWQSPSRGGHGPGPRRRLLAARRQPPAGPGGLAARPAGAPTRPAASAEAMNSARRLAPAPELTDVDEAA
jgi:hypothetical protein